MSEESLKINGGEPVRKKPMPPRKLFGEPELKKVIEVFHASWQRGVDFGFQETQEDAYTSAFCKFQGGGFADAVATGTAAILVAILSLDLPPGSDIVVSPVTDPGSITPAILLGHRICVADAKPDSYNTGPEQFARAVTPQTSAAILTHLGGHPLEMDAIMEIARTQNIKVIEDCSQAHGALYKETRIGRFGDLACFSTMFSKIHASGGCGGLVYTQDEERYWGVRAVADRGKNFHSHNFRPKTPTDYLFPGLNLNLDELSCAIGLSTLSRLQETIDRRIEIVRRIDEGIRHFNSVYPYSRDPRTKCSHYFHTVRVNVQHLKVEKLKFAQAIQAEGIDINPDYRFVVSEWEWIRPYLAKPATTPNAVHVRDTSFNILFHERYSDDDLADILSAVKKVDNVYSL